LKNSTTAPLAGDVWFALAVKKPAENTTGKSAENLY
jgi:hypothetical protein